MGLFQKRKGKKERVDWSNAYTANPHFYEKPGASSIAAIAVTEGVDTILPKAPQTRYLVDGKPAEVWKMLLVSTTKDSVIGDSDYAAAFSKIEAYILDSDKDSVLIRGLSLEELEGLRE